MSYQALYRKFRPKDFGEVYGQEHVVTALKNQLKSGRTGHAYVFSGTRGTGKTSIAKIFSKALNCESPIDGNPCGTCPSCKKITEGSSLNVLEIDGASNNKVDNVRELIEDVKYPPVEGKYKVYIIDEAHMVTTAAFNALLKTIEEPPAYAVFILATTEEKKIPITILSRCQRYNFHTITADTITKRLMDLVLQENLDIEEKALRYISRLADGSMRDALSILDKTISFYTYRRITYDLTLEMLGASDVETSSKLFRAISSQNVSEALKIVDSGIVKGIEPVTFVSDFVWYLRNLLLVKNGENIDELIDVTAENKAIIQEEINLCTNDELMRYITVLSEVVADIKYSVLNRVSLELGVIRLCKPQMDGDYMALQSRIAALENQIQTGMVRQSPISVQAIAPKQAPNSPQGPIPEPESNPPKAPISEPESIPPKAPIPEPELPTPKAPSMEAAPEGIVAGWPRVLGVLSGLHGQVARMGYPRQVSDAVVEMVVPKSKSLAVGHYSKVENIYTLAEAIESIMGQKPEIKIVAVDDGTFESGKPAIQSEAPIVNQNPYETFKKYDIFEEED